MTNTYCMYTVSRYSWWWTVDMSKTCRVLYQINMRNSASCWLSLEEYITMHGPLNVKNPTSYGILFSNMQNGSLTFESHFPLSCSGAAYNLVPTSPLCLSGCLDEGCTIKVTSSDECCRQHARPKSPTWTWLKSWFTKMLPGLKKQHHNIIKSSK